MIPETVMITNVNMGFGMDLARHILTQTKPPKVLFAAGLFDQTDLTTLQVLAEQHPILVIVPLDIGNDMSIKEAYDKVNFMLGDSGLNLLINNAGVVDSREIMLLDHSRGTLTQSYELSVVGPLLLAKTFLPLLEKACKLRPTAFGFTRAGIINLTFTFPDIATSIAVLNSYHYRASRAALSVVTRLLAKELHDSGVCVAALQPGWLSSELNDVSQSGQHVALLEEDRKDTVQRMWNTLTNLPQDASGMIFNYDGLALPT